MILLPSEESELAMREARTADADNCLQSKKINLVRILNNANYGKSAIVGINWSRFLQGRKLNTPTATPIGPSKSNFLVAAVQQDLKITDMFFYSEVI